MRANLICPTGPFSAAAIRFAPIIMSLLPTALFPKSETNFPISACKSLQIAAKFCTLQVRF